MPVRRRFTIRDLLSLTVAAALSLVPLRLFLAGEVPMAILVGILLGGGFLGVFVGRLTASKRATWELWLFGFIGTTVVVAFLLVVCSIFLSPV